MSDPSPPPAHAAVAVLRRGIGPLFALLLLAAWAVALLGPARDRAAFVAARTAGRQVLPPPPRPDRSAGIDGRTLDPDESAFDPAADLLRRPPGAGPRGRRAGAGPAPEGP
jgi:hypothetical protein